MSIEGAIHHFTLWSDYYKHIGNVKEAVDHQQVASWLQELKERREAEMRMVNRKQKEFTDPYPSPILAPLVCEATIDGIEEIKKGLDNYSKKLANDADMYIICEMAKRWIESIKRKEESE